MKTPNTSGMACVSNIHLIRAFRLDKFFLDLMPIWLEFVGVFCSSLSAECSDFGMLPTKCAQLGWPHLMASLASDGVSPTPRQKEATRTMAKKYAVASWRIFCNLALAGIGVFKLSFGGVQPSDVNKTSWVLLSEKSGSMETSV